MKPIYRLILVSRMSTLHERPSPMGDAMTAAHEVMWNCGAMALLTACVPSAVGEIVLAYAGDVRRLLIERIFQVRRQYLGPLNTAPRSDVTRLNCRVTNKCNNTWHTWVVVFRDNSRLGGGRTSCLEFQGRLPVTPTRPIRTPIFAPTITAQELWDFMAGADSPTLHSFMAGRLIGSSLAEAIVAGLRQNLRMKMTRWCAEHECAAAVRPRTAVDRPCASEVRRRAMNECAAIARARFGGGPFCGRQK